MSLKRWLIAVFALGAWAVQGVANEIPRKEYPRPQFERKGWLNL